MTAVGHESDIASSIIWQGLSMLGAVLYINSWHIADLALIAMYTSISLQMVVGNVADAGSSKSNQVELQRLRFTH